MNIDVEKVKEEFSKRLHLAMDQEGFEVRGRARALSKALKVSDKGAGKWLKGEAIPETAKMPLIANMLHVNTEWLLSGKGEMRATQSQSLGNMTQNQTIEWKDMNFSSFEGSSQLQSLMQKMVKLEAEHKLSAKDLTYLDHFLESIVKGN